MESPLGVRKGAWTKEEDLLLTKCVEKYGEGKWHQIPLRAGLNRCRKSCRLRWLNYLRPNIKRGEFTLDEVDLIMRLHKLLGNRWSLIAGRLPGRTANDVKNYWNTHIQKRSVFHQQEMKNKTQKRILEVNNIIKPQPRTFTGSLPWLRDKSTIVDNTKLKEKLCNPSPTRPTPQSDGNQWWESLIVDHASQNVATSFASGIEEDPIASLSWSEEIAPTTGELGETFVEDGHSGWSDFSFDMNIWDLLCVGQEGLLM